MSARSGVDTRLFVSIGLHITLHTCRLSFIDPVRGCVLYCVCAVSVITSRITLLVLGVR